MVAFAGPYDMTMHHWQQMDVEKTSFSILIGTANFFKALKLGSEVKHTDDLLYNKFSANSGLQPIYNL